MESYDERKKWEIGIDKALGIANSPLA